MITVWPKRESFVVSITARPVTQTALVASKRASRYERLPSLLDIGKTKRRLPARIVPKKYKRGISFSFPMRLLN
jgi:hypothetical protein